jgi:hypothetical protein
MIGIFIATACSFVFWACNSSNDPGSGKSGHSASNPGDLRTEIIVKIKGMTPGVAKLGGTFAANQFLVDSFITEGEEIKIVKEDSIYPWGYYFLLLPDGQNYVQLLLGPDQQFSMTSEITNINGKMKVSGDIDNELYYESMQWESDFQQEIAPINARMQSMDESNPEFANLRAEKSARADSGQKLDVVELV